VLGVEDANRDLKQMEIFFVNVKHWWY